MWTEEWVPVCGSGAKLYYNDPRTNTWKSVCDSSETIYGKDPITEQWIQLCCGGTYTGPGSGTGSGWTPPPTTPPPQTTDWVTYPPVAANTLPGYTLSQGFTAGMASNLGAEYNWYISVTSFPTVDQMHPGTDSQGRVAEYDPSVPWKLVSAQAHFTHSSGYTTGPGTMIVVANSEDGVTTPPAPVEVSRTHFNGNETFNVFISLVDVSSIIPTDMHWRFVAHSEGDVPWDNSGTNDAYVMDAITTTLTLYFQEPPVRWVVPAGSGTGGGTGGSTDGGTGGTVSNMDALPWDLLDTYPNAKPVMAHYFTQFPLRHSNSATPTYYIDNWLKPGAIENGTDHRVYGGWLRDIPLNRPVVGADWALQDMIQEVRWALDAKIDGFFVDLLSIDQTSAHWKNLMLLFQASDAEFDTSGRRCWIAPMPDGTATPCNTVISGTTVDINASATNLVNALLLLKDQAALWKPWGRFVLPIFGPEKFKSGMSNPDSDRIAFWTKVKDDLTQASLPTDLWACYVDTWTDPQCAPAFNDIVIGHGRWGGRDDVDTARTDNNNGNAAYYCHTTFNRKWMHFGSPGDTRPRDKYPSTSDYQGYRIWEPRGSKTLNNTMLAGINGADMIQLTTWNDYSEHAHICPSRNNSYVWLDLLTYYIARYKNGAYPTLVRDAVYLIHRIHPYAQTGFTGVQSKFAKHVGATPQLDIVEVRAFAVAPGTVEFMVDGVVKSTQSITTGDNRLEFPLPSTGVVSARIKRNNAVVDRTTVTSTVTLTSAQIADDFHPRCFSSLRQIQPPPPPPSDANYGQLLFEDNFSGSTVDTAKWNVRNNSTQNNHDGIAMAANCSVHDGMLSIRSGTSGDPSKPWTCGYLDTIGKFGLRYGIWEARMRVPWGTDAYGYWPAFWLRPDNPGATTDGEIDIMEAWPSQTAIHATLHHDELSPHTFPSKGGPELSDRPGFNPEDWHVYRMEKNPGSMKFYIDGELYWTVDSSVISWYAAIFDTVATWNIRLQLQIGGSYGGQPTGSTNLANTFDIDYVRVYGPATTSGGGSGGAASVFINPGDDLVAKIAAAAAGATIQINAGTYKITSPIIPKTGQTIIANGTVYIDGSVRKTAWTPDGSGRWYASHTFQARDSTMRDGSYSICEDSALAGTGVGGGSGANAFNSCWNRDMAWWDGVRMTPVVSLAAGDAAGGNPFYIDRTNNRLYVFNDPSAHTVEIDATPYAIKDPAVNTVKWIGIRFRRFASPLQRGAVNLTSVNGWEFSNCNFDDNHALGMFWNNCTSMWVHNSTFGYNGQLGMGAGTSSSGTVYSNNVIENNVFIGNNTEDFYIGDWEAGGIKVSSKSGGIIRNNTFTDNKGLDIWTDSAASNWVIDGNICDGAWGQAIRTEISSRIIVRNNVITGSGYNIGNHYRAAHSNWHTVMDTAGISCSECSNVEIYNNTVDSTSLNGIIVNVRGRTNASPTGADHIFVHDNTVTQRQAPIPTGTVGTSTVGTMVAGGINLNGAPQPLSYYIAAATWTMPTIGPFAGSGKQATRLVDVKGNHYRVGDLGTTRRFVWGAGSYQTATTYAGNNPADATDTTV